MLEVPIESPALVADHESRRQELLTRATDAMGSPPASPPPPFAIPQPTPSSPDEWWSHIDLQVSCWERAFGRLSAAAKEEAEAGELRRYQALTEALGWVYAVDSSLNTLWRGLTHDMRHRLSTETDKRAGEAATHNKAVMPNFQLETDYAFAGYRKRLADGQPYKHWADLMLAGVFQARFFAAIGWVRGQLVHAATSAPMDLRQYKPGAEPRWKWRESSTFARGRPDEASRHAYDELLATHDVLGLLSHLTDVFVGAKHRLCAGLRGA